jgi:glucose-6-phosphate isomerase
VTYQTGPVVWGEPGTNGQHSFYQLIHQGTKLIPADFLAPALSHNPMNEHHPILLSHFCPAPGPDERYTKEEVIEELRKEGRTDDEIQRLYPYRVFEGNGRRILFFKKMTPRVLGNLIAMYEHKIFVQGDLEHL